ncbi:mannose-6-phosphate isomerase, class I [Streptomyces sp. CC53]|uniref:mannose-6-phosphate isomerase, class I n=1 Tax=unclassified Streptomyces TaxID=2593676 RepID=UPI0008DD2EAC|nr:MULTISPECIES: mannose-6-phosphate isomerase, class I [unclassified Streptomyces]OII64889.1 mannose-6-phosphate isomerase, class I [Streptomyces sp. CC53]
MDRLSNTVRPYAWGSTTAIPDLLGTAPTGEPQAEMWMGAHPAAPSRVTRTAPDGTPHDQTLSDVIAADPARELGPETAARFGPHLPFLLKVLAAAAPLSLQVHPDRAQAEAGYAREEQAGIPLHAAHRTYKDPHHKPELICALTPFEGLCGFRPPAETADLLASLDVDSLKPYVDVLHAHPEDAALREVLTAVLTADPDAMADTIAATAAACTRTGGHLAPYAELAHHYPGDPGVIAALLLNHVRLQPGEALYLGAGVPHAYIKGLGVEIMASSDNVLRCGLTPKHVDVPELLRVVRFDAAAPDILRPEASESGEELYEAPVDDFRLSRYVRPEGSAPVDLTAPSAQVVLATAGTPHLGELRLDPGQSVYVPAGEPAELSGTGTVFRATVAP